MVTISVTDVNEPPAAPGAPTVTPTSGSTTSLDVSWTAPTNTGTGTTTTITGLTASTSYQVQVKAKNDEGDSTWSASGTGSTGTLTATAPPAPTGLTATAGDAEVTLSWTSGGDGGSAITKHQYRQKAGSGSYGSWTNIANSGASGTNATSFKVESLTNGTAYTFQVRPANVIGNGAASNEATATLVPVTGPAVTAVSAKSTGLTTATVTVQVTGCNHRNGIPANQACLGAQLAVDRRQPGPGQRGRFRAVPPDRVDAQLRVRREGGAEVHLRGRR